MGKCFGLDRGFIIFINFLRFYNLKIKDYIEDWGFKFIEFFLYVSKFIKYLIIFCLEMFICVYVGIIFI